MPARKINLGFSYVPNSIRARSGSLELHVEETDSISGQITIEVPTDFAGKVSVDYQRQIFQRAAPRPTKILGAASACIYCGSTSSLSDEHIIPYALEGEFVIREASCKLCAKKISRFERKILRDALLAQRTAMRLRTRRPRERPTSLPLVHTVEGVETIAHVPVADHPTYLALPLFALPAYLRGDDLPNLKVVAPGARIVSVSATTLQAAASRVAQGEIGVRNSLDIYAFAKLLAKIAHGFVAIADLGNVEVYLPGAMFASDESIGKWVGGAPDEKLTAEGLHACRIEIIEGEILVRIRLFAQLGGPEYLVVAGRLIDHPGTEPFVIIDPSSGEKRSA
jgi:hypothetical protein